MKQCLDILSAPENLCAPGLHRQSANAVSLQKLRAQIDKQIHLSHISDMTDDVHAISGVLKQFLRELPDSIFPRSKYHVLIDATRLEDSEALIRIHEVINELDDYSYAALRELMKHLDEYVLSLLCHC
jgi:hypothetical protein